MNVHLKRRIRKILSPIRRIGLNNYNFTIISNNCWGGVIYDILGLKYLSPTIGCYMMAEDYLKFISDLDYYLSIDVIPLFSKDEDMNDAGTSISIPKGKLDDLTIYFVHYSDSIIAAEKWNARRKRVNFENMLVKNSDQNEFNESLFEKFQSLSFENKVFFTSNRNLKGKENYVYFIDKYEKNGYAVDDIKSSFKIVNFKKILNNMVVTKKKD